MKSGILTILIALVQVCTFAQPNLALGEWANELPYQRGSSAAISPTFFYWGTQWSIQRLRRDDLSSSFVDRAAGLNNTNIVRLAYDESTLKLLICYRDGSLDVWDEASETTNYVVDIKNNIQVVGDKQVRHISFFDNIAYLSTDFGLLTYNMEVEVFGFTLLLIDEKAIAATEFGTNIFLSTNKGLRMAPQTGANLQDLGSWPILGTAAGFPSSYTSGAIQMYNDKLYAVVNNELFRYENNTLTLLDTVENGYEIEYLSAEGPDLIIGLRCQTPGCANDKVYKMNVNEQFSLASGNGCANTSYYAVQSDNGTIVYADLFDGMRFTADGDGNCNAWNFNSPYSNNVWAMDVSKEGDLAVASGGLSETSAGLGKTDGVFIRNGSDWRTYSFRNTQILNDSSCTEDFVSIAYDPSDNAVWAGSFWGGVARIQGDSVAVYNEDNSTIEVDLGDNSRSRVMDLEFDTDQNLWLCSFNSAKPITLKTKAGDWFSYNSPLNKCIALAIDRNNFKWVVGTGSTPGLAVFDDNGTFDNTTDDNYRQFNSANSAMEANPNCLAVDINGDVWVGTRDGAVRFSCGGNVDQCFSDAPIVDLDGIPAVLLDDQEVRVIAIDGANQKWFGTTSGVFVVSSDGSQQIAFYNTSNSPLLSNEITSIAIDAKDGYVYIGTANGISVLRANATEGTQINKLTAYAFPNPVQPDYEGPIAINGLAQDADVKITDISGQLIWQGRAYGAQAVWNGLDYNGRRAASGVYLIFSTSTSSFGSPDTLVAKVVIVRG